MMGMGMGMRGILSLLLMGKRRRYSQVFTTTQAGF